MREKIGVSREDRVQIMEDLMGLRDDLEDEEDFNERRDVLLAELDDDNIGGANHEQAMAYFTDFTETLFKYCVKPSLDNQWIDVNFQTNR